MHAKSEGSFCATAVQKFRDKYEPPPKRKASSEPGSVLVLNIVADDVIGPCRHVHTDTQCTSVALSVSTALVLCG